MILARARNSPNSPFHFHPDLPVCDSLVGPPRQAASLKPQACSELENVLKSMKLGKSCSTGRLSHTGRINTHLLLRRINTHLPKS